VGVGTTKKNRLVSVAQSWITAVAVNSWTTEPYSFSGYTVSCVRSHWPSSVCGWKAMAKKPQIN